MLKLFLLVAYAFAAHAWPSPRGSDGLAPYSRAEDTIFEDEYIIHFHEGHTLADHQSATGLDVANLPDFRELDWLPGYRAALSNNDVHRLVRRDPGVKLVEHDIARAPPSFSDAFNVDDSTTANIINRDNDASNLIKRQFGADFSVTVQRNVPWGLQMISSDQRQDRGSESTLSRAFDYPVIDDAGKGVNVYVLDSGVRTTHEAFGGRAVNFKLGTTCEFCKPLGETTDDLRGHGTHVAGTIAGTGIGVAPQASIVSVKIYGSQAGSDSLLAAALSAVVEEHKERKRDNDGTWRGSVINMSLEGNQGTAALRVAIKRATRENIPLVAAAGNHNVAADNKVPCSMKPVICVGAVDRAYGKWDVSNYGSALTILAPGSGVYSAVPKNDTTYGYKSGTSMAAPHVAGAIAIWTGWENAPSLDSIMDRLDRNSASGLITGFDSSTPNVFVGTGIQHIGKPVWAPYIGAPFHGHDDLKAVVLNNTKAINDTAAGIKDVAASSVIQSGTITPSFTPTTSTIVETLPPVISSADPSSMPSLTASLSVTIDWPSSSSPPPAYGSPTESPTTTAAATPTAVPTCSVSMEVDAWSGDVDEISPFWIQVQSMTNSAGTNLNPDSTWAQCGSQYPCEVSSDLSDKLQLAPITADPGNYESTPYVQITLGSQNWASNAPTTPQLGCNAITTNDLNNGGLLAPNPIHWNLSCWFQC